MLKNYAKCFGIIVLTHSLFFLFWFITTKKDESIVRTYISLLEMAADIFLPPILLVFFVSQKTERPKHKKYKKNLHCRNCRLSVPCVFGLILGLFQLGIFYKTLFYARL
ncbi:hypothetical protein [Treponema zioleckii]|uniref:hypothetical protein n=1 Tax=Treponema zioleckii TaxID=331680 RepID=UPI00168B1685|nr:hypothetical protein [Treponema zioleckii]